MTSNGKRRKRRSEPKGHEEEKEGPKEQRKNEEKEDEKEIKEEEEKELEEKREEEKFLEELTDNDPLAQYYEGPTMQIILNKRIPRRKRTRLHEFLGGTWQMPDEPNPSS